MKRNTKWPVILGAAACMMQVLPVQVQAAPADTEFSTSDTDAVYDWKIISRNSIREAVLVKAELKSDEKTEIELPEMVSHNGEDLSVTGIAAGAFQDSPLRVITIPGSVTEMEDGAFENCPDLNKVVLEVEEDGFVMNLSAWKHCEQANLYSASGTLLYAAPKGAASRQAENAEADQEADSQTREDLKAQEESAVSVIRSEAAETEEEGSFYTTGKWVKSGSDWYYEENGKRVTSAWRTINGQTYYLQTNGKMARGWLKLGKEWYYLNKDGAMLRNTWVDKNNYVNGQGLYVASTWTTKEGKPVYQLGDGTLLKNAWRKKGSTWYWLTENGFPFCNGWKTIDNKTYYFEDSGAMAANTWKGEYYLAGDGHRFKPGWEQEGSKFRYLNMDGNYVKNSWKTIENKIYYFGSDGVMKTGLANVNGSTYFFGNDGEARKEYFVRYGNKTYYADGSGRILKLNFRIKGVRFMPASDGSITSAAVNDHIAGIPWGEIFSGSSQLHGAPVAEAVIKKQGQPSGQSLTKTVNGTSYQLLRFPMKTMAITQGANGQFTHQGVEALDLAGNNSGQDPVYAPCDMHLVGSLSYERGHGMFFHSDQKVLFADGTIDYASFLFLHDSYIGDIKDSYKQWEEFADEGVAGYATGNHCHFEVAKGHVPAKYFLNVYSVYGLRNSVPVDAACVIDGVKLLSGGQTQSSGNTMNWKNSSQVSVSSAPSQKPSGAVDQQGKFWVTTDAIKVRKQPGKEGDPAGYTLRYGQSVVYDCYIRKEGYTWLGFVDKNGNRRWVASGEHNGKDYTRRYGVFE